MESWSSGTPSHGPWGGMGLVYKEKLRMAKMGVVLGLNSRGAFMNLPGGREEETRAIKTSELWGLLGGGGGVAEGYLIQAIGTRAT